MKNAIETRVKGRCEDHVGGILYISSWEYLHVHLHVFQARENPCSLASSFFRIFFLLDRFPGSCFVMLCKKIRGNNSNATLPSLRCAITKRYAKSETSPFFQRSGKIITWLARNLRNKYILDPELGQIADVLCSCANVLRFLKCVFTAITQLSGRH